MIDKAVLRNAENLRGRRWDPPLRPSYRGMLRDGPWEEDVVFAQLLAVCSIMAVTGTATNGIGMRLATTAVLVVSNALFSPVRHLVSSDVRIPVFVVLIATLVTMVDMALNARLHELYKVLGLFIALIVVSCAILGRAEAFASRSPALASAVDGLAVGPGFTDALTLIGAVPELLGSGTLFAIAYLLLGEAFALLELKLILDCKGVLLMVLPSGGFLALGFVLAARRVLESRLAARQAPPGAAALPSARGPAMQVSVTYNEPPQQVWLRIEVPEECTAAQAIGQLGILSSFPHIDLESRKVGAFGKVATLDAPVSA